MAPGRTRGRNVRSKNQCSMCPAIHTKSRSWLRSSSTREPSDPLLRVVFFIFEIRRPLFCVRIFIRKSPRREVRGFHIHGNRIARTPHRASRVLEDSAKRHRVQHTLGRQPHRGGRSSSLASHPCRTNTPFRHGSCGGEKAPSSGTKDTLSFELRSSFERVSSVEVPS